MVNFLRTQRRDRRLYRLVAALAGLALVVQAVPLSQVRASVPNPPLTQSCGIDVALVVDVSGSINATEMGQMKTALADFAGAFEGTPTEFSLSKFSTVGEIIHPFSLTPAEAVTAIQNDLPERGTGYTNWDDGLAKGFATFDPRPTKPNLLVIATDGSPNRYGNPANPTIDWDGGLTYAVEEADAIKTAGTRIVAVGIGADPNDPDYPDVDYKYQAITGPNFAPPAPIDVTTDVIKTDFDALGQAMAELVQSLCGGKILIQKQFDTDGDGKPDVRGDVPDPILAGYTFDVRGDLANPDPQTTTDTGALEFITPSGTYRVGETIHQPQTYLSSAVCYNGHTEVGTVDLENRRVTDLVIGTDDTISCTFVNAYELGSLKVVKHVVNDDGGTKLAADFTLTVVSKTGEQEIIGNEDGVEVLIPAGPFNVKEAPSRDYLTTMDGCSGTFLPGENKVCRVVNDDIHVGQCLLEITKTVDRAEARPGDNLTYRLEFQNVGDADCTGSGVKISDDVSPRLTFISETHSDNVEPGYGGDPLFDGTQLKWGAQVFTLGEQGYVTWTAAVNELDMCGSFDLPNTARISAHEYNGQWVESNSVNTTIEKSCTAKLVVIKHVVNDEGGKAQASDFKLLVSGSRPTPNAFPGDENGTEVEIYPGDYSVSENQLPGYTMRLDGECEGTIAAGEVKRCQVVNDDMLQKGTLEVVKRVVNDNGGTKQAADFEMKVAAANDFSTTFPGDENGTRIMVDPGAYRVDEEAMRDYIKTLGDECTGTIAVGEVKHCLVINDDVEPGRLIVTKHVVNDDGGHKQASDFKLKVAGNNPNPGSFPGDEGGTPVAVYPGDYSVDEDELPGYAKTLQGDCTGTIASGETKTCKVVNDDIKPDQCELKIVKSVDQRLVTAGNALTYDIKVSNVGTASCTGGTDSGIAAGVKLEDLLPNHLTFVSETHSANVTPGYGGDPLFDGVTLKWDAQVLEPGESAEVKWNARVEIPKTCGTFDIFNVARVSAFEYDWKPVDSNIVQSTFEVPCESSLLVKKHVINDNGGTLEAPDFNLTVLTKTTEYGVVGNEDGVLLTLEPGTYQVKESPVRDYVTSYSDDCVGELLFGESKTCVVTNDDVAPPPPGQANLIVTKHVINDNGGTLAASDFTLTATTPDGERTVTGDEAGVTLVVSPGDYSVDELVVPSGYAKSLGADCTGSLSAGETKSCVVTNDDIYTPPPPGQATLIVIKHVVNDNSGTLLASDFTMSVTAANGTYANSFAGAVAPGVSLTVDPGDYTVDEPTVPTGYTKSLGTDCSGTLAAGEVKTCTVTNDDIAPPPPTDATLVVIKHVINDNGGVAAAASFTMNVTAGFGTYTNSFPGAEDPGLNLAVPTGDYSVDETLLPGYVKTLGADCAGTILAGETKTCTITNDDAGGGGGGCTGSSCSPAGSLVNASITCGPNATLSFTYGSDVTGISLSSSLDFSAAPIVSPVPSMPWSIPAGDGHMVYLRFHRSTGGLEIRQASTTGCSTPLPQVLGAQCVNVVQAEQDLVTSPSTSFTNANKGKILLQTDAHGEAWYVYPTTGLKYYLPATNAFNILKLFGDGITNANLAKIPVGFSPKYTAVDTDNDALSDELEGALGTNPALADTDSDGYADRLEIESNHNPNGTGDLNIDTTFAAQQKGRFFLQVEGGGQLWYVNPADGKRYLMPNSNQAYTIITSFGVGMSNEDIRKIPVGDEVKGVEIGSLSPCYEPTPQVLGAMELPRTGFPIDLAQAMVLPPLAAYPWLKRRYAGALARYFGGLTN